MHAEKPQAFPVGCFTALRIVLLRSLTYNAPDLLNRSCQLSVPSSSPFLLDASHAEIAEFRQSCWFLITACYYSFPGFICLLLLAFRIWPGARPTLNPMQMGHTSCKCMTDPQTATKLSPLIQPLSVGVGCTCLMAILQCLVGMTLEILQNSK